MSGAWLWLLVPLAPLLAAPSLAIWRERAIGWLWLLQDKACTSSCET